MQVELKVKTSLAPSVEKLVTADEAKEITQLFLDQLFKANALPKRGQHAKTTGIHTRTGTELYLALDCYPDGSLVMCIALPGELQLEATGLINGQHRTTKKG